jgi:hypothetical protein
VSSGHLIETSCFHFAPQIRSPSCLKMETISFWNMCLVYNLDHEQDWRLLMNFNSSSLRSSLYSLGVDPQKTPLPLLLHVDSLQQRCVYHDEHCADLQRTPLLTPFVAWRHSVRDTFFCCMYVGHYLATAVSLRPHSCFKPRYTEPRGMNQREATENCKWRSFMICTSRIVLWEWCNWGG